MLSRRLVRWFKSFPEDPHLSTVDWIIANGFCFWGLIICSPIILILWIWDSFTLYDAVTGNDKTKAEAELLNAQSNLHYAEVAQQRVEQEREQEMLAAARWLTRGGGATQAEKIRKLTEEYEGMIEGIRKMAGIDDDSRTAIINQKLEELARRLQTL